jgi:hypothetical protein
MKVIKYPHDVLLSATITSRDTVAVWKRNLFTSCYIVSLAPCRQKVGTFNRYLKTVRRPYALSSVGEIRAAVEINSRRAAIRAARNLAKEHGVSELFILG